MKSFDELKQLQEQAKKNFEDKDTCKYRVIVGMATCGIAAGATMVYQAMLDKVETGDYNCKVVQTGCIGMCTLEPIVEVINENNEKTTYVYMTPEKVDAVMDSHIKNGEIVEEYTVNSVVNKEA